MFTAQVTVPVPVSGVAMLIPAQALSNHLQPALVTVEHGHTVVPLYNETKVEMYLPADAPVGCL